MRSHYQRLREQPEPPTLKPEDKERVGKYLWSNFNRDLKLTESPSPDLLKTCLKRAIYDQGASLQDAPSQLLSYMSVPDLQFYCTHLYVWIQLSHMLQDAYQGQAYLQTFQESPYFQKAFAQANPYILRYHVFALHNKIHSCMTSEKQVDDPAWQAKKRALVDETLKTLQKVTELAPRHPALAHFLSGYCYYSLAMTAEGAEAMEYWEKAYTEFLSCEAMEKKFPRASFIVNLGKGLYKDMPFDNLVETKQTISQILGSAKTQAIASQLAESLSLK